MTRRKYSAIRFPCLLGSLLVGFGARESTQPATERESTAMSDPTPNSAHPAPSVYAQIGAAPFATLVELHYQRIDKDPRVREMFPADLGPQSEAVRNLREFFIQYFGGPQDYSARKGHPRLRARHMGFKIDQAARDAWLEHALASLDDSAAMHHIPAACKREIGEYLFRVSQFMINTD